MSCGDTVTGLMKKRPGKRTGQSRLSLFSLSAEYWNTCRLKGLDIKENI